MGSKAQAFFCSLSDYLGLHQTFFQLSWVNTRGLSAGLAGAVNSTHARSQPSQRDAGKAAIEWSRARGNGSAAARPHHVASVARLLVTRVRRPNTEGDDEREREGWCVTTDK